jgi:hypothetical protein
LVTNDGFLADRSQSPGHRITGDGVADGLGDYETESRGARVIRRHPSTAPHNGTKVVCPRHPVNLGEHGEARSGRELRGEFGATLAAASCKDGATGTGAHAKTKTVDLRAAAVVRLKSSLAHSCISKAQLWRPEKM